MIAEGADGAQEALDEYIAERRRLVEKVMDVCFPILVPVLAMIFLSLRMEKSKSGHPRCGEQPAFGEAS
jgi:hypothetical protein